MPAKVVYFNIDGGLDYENELLAEWGVADRIELIGATTEDSSEDTFVEAVHDADGVVVEYFEVTRTVLERLPKLKIISLQAIGVSNVDIDAATDHGVGVTNTPGFCSEDVALHTVGMIIDLARKISFLDRSVRSGHWDPMLGGLPTRVAGKTVGLVFFGSIPKLMVPLLKAIGMRVIAYAPTKTVEYLEDFGVAKVETLEELLRESDVVSLHTPLLPETRHLISTEELDLMKPSAFLVNTARGAVVNEQALVAALTTGQIAGAGIDVIEDEVNEKSDLFNLENVVITPHAAFISKESLADGRRIALSQLVQRLVTGETPSNLVNKGVGMG